MKKESNDAITMDDIARLANVSKPTVSRALANNPLVKADTREKILKIARQHGYVVNRNAQKLRSTRTDTVAVILDFTSFRERRRPDPFVYDFSTGVSAELSGRHQD